MSDDIESMAFAARVSVASSPGAFRRYVLNSPLVHHAIARCKLSDRARQEIVARVRALVAEHRDHPGRTNDHDVAIAAYLLILAQVPAAELASALDTVEEHPDTLWWTAQIVPFLRSQAIDPGTVSSSDIAPNGTRVLVQTATDTDLHFMGLKGHLLDGGQIRIISSSPVIPLRLGSPTSADRTHEAKIAAGAR